MFGNLSTKGSNFRNVLSSSLETATLRVYGMEDDMIDVSLRNALSNMDLYTNHLFTVCVCTHTCVCVQGQLLGDTSFLLPCGSTYQPQLPAKCPSTKQPHGHCRNS